MKKIGLIFGILLTLLSLLGGVVCLLLPTLTDNRVSFDEAILGLIPAVLLFVLGLLLTIICAVLVRKGRTAQVHG